MFKRGLLTPLLLASVFLVGTATPYACPAADKDDKKDEPKRVEIGKNVTIEVQGTARRVLVNSTVCLQKGPLEVLLTRTMTKEHESILAVDADARVIHAALTAAGAVPGSPVKFDPKYVPASGTVIKVTLVYQDKDNKTIRVPAQHWIRNSNTQKTLDKDWVFGGSKFVPNPLEPNKRLYLANDGDLICISNFETAMLDLPIKVSKDAADLVWECNVEKIPPMGTKVTVILEPVVEKK